MVKTLLLYDGKMSSAERIAERLSCLIGHAKTAEFDEAPEDLTPYGGVCVLFNFYGAVTAGRTRAYLGERGEALRGKRIIMVGIGISDLGYTKYVTDTEDSAGLEDIAGIFISSESEALRAGYEIGRILHEPEREMEEHRLAEAIGSFIRGREELSLATAGEGFVRCTPLDYLYLDSVFYIVTEGGSKFRGILENGDVAAAVYTPGARAGGRIQCLQITGKAQPVPVGSDEYVVAMAARGLTEERLRDMPVTLFLLKLIPFRYEFLNTDFEEEGYDARQVLDTEFGRRNREAGAVYAFEEARAETRASEKLKAEAAAAAERARRREEEEAKRREAEELRALKRREEEEEAETLVREAFTEPEETEAFPEEAVGTAEALSEENADTAEDLPGETAIEAEGVSSEAADTAENVPKETADIAGCHPEDAAGETENLSEEIAGETEDLSEDAAGETENLPEEAAGETEDLPEEAAGETENLPEEAAGETENLPEEAAGAAEDLSEDELSAEAFPDDEEDEDDWEEQRELEERIRLDSRRYLGYTRPLSTDASETEAASGEVTLAEDAAASEEMTGNEEGPVSGEECSSESETLQETAEELKHRAEEVLFRPDFEVTIDEVDLTDVGEEQPERAEAAEAAAEDAEAEPEPKATEAVARRRRRRSQAGARKRGGLFGRLGRGLAELLKIDSEADTEEERLEEQVIAQTADDYSLEGFDEENEE